jgi:hypothetical protein
VLRAVLVVTRIFIASCNCVLSKMIRCWHGHAKTSIHHYSITNKRKGHCLMEDIIDYWLQSPKFDKFTVIVFLLRSNISVGKVWFVFETKKLLWRLELLIVPLYRPILSYWRRKNSPISHCQFLTYSSPQIISCVKCYIVS